MARFLLSYRTTPHVTTGRTPAEMFVNRQLRTRLSAIKPDLGNKIMKGKCSTKAREYQVGDVVLVKDYRKDADPWVKGTIHEVLGPVTYRVQVGAWKWKRHVDQILTECHPKLDLTPQRSEYVPPMDVSPMVTMDTSVPVVPVPSKDTSVSVSPVPITKDIVPESPRGTNTKPIGSPRRSGRTIQKPRRLVEE